MQRKKVFEHHFDMAWGDMDALAHVNNGKYFDYFQEARIQWLRQLEIDFDAQDTGPILLSIGCTFLKPVVYPAKLCTKVFIHSLGNTSFHMDYDLFQAQNMVAQGTSKIVWVNYQQNKSIPVPDSIRSEFKRPGLPC